MSLFSFNTKRLPQPAISQLAPLKYATSLPEWKDFSYARPAFPDVVSTTVNKIPKVSISTSLDVAPPTLVIPSSISIPHYSIKAPPQRNPTFLGNSPIIGNVEGIYPSITFKPIRFDLPVLSSISTILKDISIPKNASADIESFTVTKPSDIGMLLLNSIFISEEYTNTDYYTKFKSNFNWKNSNISLVNFGIYDTLSNTDSTFIEISNLWNSWYSNLSNKKLLTKYSILYEKTTYELHQLDIKLQSKSDQLDSYIQLYKMYSDNIRMLNLKVTDYYQYAVTLYEEYIVTFSEKINSINDLKLLSNDNDIKNKSLFVSNQDKINSILSMINDLNSGLIDLYSTYVNYTNSLTSLLVLGSKKTELEAEWALAVSNLEKEINLNQLPVIEIKALQSSVELIVAQYSLAQTKLNALKSKKASYQNMLVTKKINLTDNVTLFNSLVGGNNSVLLKTAEASKVINESRYNQVYGNIRTSDYEQYVKFYSEIKSWLSKSQILNSNNADSYLTALSQEYSEFYKDLDKTETAFGDGASTEYAMNRIASIMAKAKIESTLISIT